MIGQPAAPTTAPEAAALLNTRTADPAWGQRLMAGDVATRAEFNNLTKMILEADAGAEALAGKSSQPFVWTGENGQLSPQALSQGINTLRESGLSDEVIKQVLDGEKMPVTRAEYDAAKRLMAQRQNDSGWVQKLMSGDAEARREFSLLTVIINSTVREAA